MNREETLCKLISIRHCCFVQGIRENKSDFRMAFRDVNRAYVTVRDERVGACTFAADHRSGPAQAKPHADAPSEPKPQNAKKRFGVG